MALLTLFPTGMLSFRIISGQHKGRRLTAPKKLPVRPTTDRAKEALFNILVHQLDFEHCDLLDLYAGTGNISYEFTSRGGRRSMAIDNHKGCIRFIRETAEKLSLPIQPVMTDVTSFLEKNSQSFDLVFMDPPFDCDFAFFDKNIRLILDSHWFEKGLLIVEHPPEMDWETDTEWQETRRYGGSHFTFFAKE